MDIEYNCEVYADNPPHPFYHLVVNGGESVYW